MRYQQPFGQNDPESPYVNGNPATGTQGSIPPAAAFEHPQRELVALIEASGMAPDEADLTQVAVAVQSQRVNYAVAGGTANALTCTFDPPLTEYRPGLPLRVKAAVNNTGAMTINAGAGVVSIIAPNGAALVADDVEDGMLLDLVFDGTAFQLANKQKVDATNETINNYTVDIPYAAAGGTANALTAAFNPAVTAMPAGKPVLVKITTTNTGAATIAINALAAMPIKYTNGNAIAAGALVAGMIALMVSDGVNMQVLNPIVTPEAVTPGPWLIIPGAVGCILTTITYGQQTAISYAGPGDVTTITGYQNGGQVLTVGSDYVATGNNQSPAGQVKSVGGYTVGTWRFVSLSNVFWDPYDQSKNHQVMMWQRVA